MAIEIKQQLRLSQQLVMTPQLQQAIKLLQLSRLELVNLVQQELQENPILEETLETEEPPAPNPEAAPAPAPELEPSEAAAATEPPTEREPTQAEKIADVDWQSYMDAYPQTGFSEAREEDERRSFENTLTRRPSLAEHLEWQLQLSSLDEKEREAARWIIGNVDDDGYLQDILEEMARQSGLELALFERALAKVQAFDPVGVAARDLRECLLVQLRALGETDPLVLRIVDEHLPLLQKRDFRGLSRVLGATLEAVAAAARVIGHLEPRPGRAFGGDDPIYITPDIYVYKIGDEFHVLLNEDGLPKLRINNLYREVLARGSNATKDTKDYVQDKVRSALWLIKSIHQRQRTIYKVMQSIIKHQREFFERGINFLKPLNLRDVAEDIEMHESTVSRVTTNKYVHTPQGIFELKYFFNSSISRFDGEAVASESVKERIRKLIASEDPRRPLSDQRIAEMLKAANLDIARRTVTKYREAMNILSSTKRRQVG
jgi:RNA polymerase sigma-54 factor